MADGHAVEPRIFEDSQDQSLVRRNLGQGAQVGDTCQRNGPFVEGNELE